MLEFFFCVRIITMHLAYNVIIHVNESPQWIVIDLMNMNMNMNMIVIIPGIEVRARFVRICFFDGDKVSCGSILTHSELGVLF